MRYGLESTLPIRAFSPRAKGPFARGMTLEGGGGGGGGVFGSLGDTLASIDPGPAISNAISSVGNIIDSAAQSVGQALASVDPGPAIGNLGKSLGTGLSEAGLSIGQLLANGEKYIGQTLDSTGHWVDVTVDRLGNTIVHTLNSGAQALGNVGAHLDKAVKDNVPGGWGTVAGIAAMVAAPYIAPEFLASNEAVGTAATALEGGATPVEAAAAASDVGGWTADSVLKGVQDFATAAGTGAAKGAGVGAATAALAGKDPLQGAIKGAEFGGLTGGVGDLAQAADLGSVGTKLAQAAAPSLITGADPTKNLVNTALSLGAGAVGNELGVDNQISQAALTAGKALASGQDPTQALLKTAIGAGVGAGTNEFSKAFKDAIDNGMTPEQAYTVASQTEGASPVGISAAETGGISNQTIDEQGNTVFTYDDGSSLTVSPDGEVVDATESATYQDPYQDTYVDPGAPDDKATSGGALDTAAKQATGQFQSQLNKGITSALTKAVAPTAPVKRAVTPIVSRAQTARSTYAPVSTLAPTQATATQILSGALPTQATPGVMTPAERMAAIAKAFGGGTPLLMPTTTNPSQTAQPVQTSPYVFASGGTVDFSEEFIDKSLGVPAYIKPGITHGRGGYTMPGYPFGQLWRIGMAEGGEVEGHNPEFFSEGGLNSLENTYVKGDGDGTSDSIPAMLANGEFVIPADVVSGLGNGSNDSGAKVLDEFLKTIRKHKQKSGADKLPPDSKGPLGYLLEAKKKVKT